MRSEDFDKDTLAAIVPLRSAGFALHWLHGKSKRPVGKHWSEAPVASLELLQATHSRGSNLGVRLGEPSLLSDGSYLHVLDFDIRVPELADECWEAFARLFPHIDPASLPMVASGSGGESRHLYFTTSQPFRSKRLATSEGKHRTPDGSWHFDWEIELFGTGKQVVLPPSIHPDTGRPYTWEREFPLDMLSMGLSPTIPASEIERIGAVKDEALPFEGRPPLEFKNDHLDRILDSIETSELHYDDWVRLGQALHHQFGGSQEGFDLWVRHTKRSAKFGKKQRPEQQLREMRRVKWPSFGRYRGAPVTMATIVEWHKQANIQRLQNMFDEEDEPEGDAQTAPEIPETRGNPPSEGDALDAMFGEPAAPAPAKPKSPPRESLPGFDDDDETETAEGDDFDDLKEAAKPNGEISWVSLLHLNEEGAIKPTLHNLRLIVENDIWTRGVMAFNEFTQEIVQRGTPGRKKPKRANQAKPVLQLDGSSWVLRDRVNGDFWTEDKDNAIRALIEAPDTQGGYGIKVPDRDLRAAIDIVGRKNPFHPVREYLSSVSWDGVPRVEQLFTTYMGSPDDAYHRAVSRIMMVAGVTRVFEPGTKFDTAVILEGVQGKRKSTFISILAKNWFTELDGDVTDTKQMVENLQGAWIAELNELGGFAKADVRHIKAFISRRSDKVRLAYAKRAQEYHRQSILIGSTNDDVYLKDSTGGRRFLPVKCVIEGEIDTERLEREIDQLWAEAHHMYREMRAAQPTGTLPLYLADNEARQIAERLQESRQVESTEDALAGRISEWLAKPINTGSMDNDTDDDGNPIYRTEVCLLQIWCECLERDDAQYTGMWPAALGRAMRKIEGWRETTRRPRFPKYGQQRAFERMA